MASIARGIRAERITGQARRMIALTRRTLLGVATAALVAGGLPATAAATDTSYRPDLPAPTGPYPVGTTDLHLVDQSRTDPWASDGKPRELMTTVWYPAVPGRGSPAPYAPAKAGPMIADELGTALGLKPGQIDLAGASTHARTGAAAIGRHPVVLFSPGLGTSRVVATNQVEDLASRGYVVVTMDHTGEAPVEFPDGRVTSLLVPDNGLEKAIAVRVADTRFVLGALERLAAGDNPDAERRRLPPGLGRSLDIRRTGMFGYSAGGFTAAETMLVDRRLDAGINLDGTMQYAWPDGKLSESAKRGLDRPFLLFGAGGHSHLRKPGTPLDDPSWASFWANQRGWKLDIQLADGTHAAFADYQFMVAQLDRKFDLPDALVREVIGTVDPERSVAAQRAYVGAFFDQMLKHRPQPLLWRESRRYPEITFVR